MRHDNDRLSAVNAAIVALLASIFALELLTPLGIVEWIFYLVPVGLCLLHARPSMALVVAGAVTVLIIAGLLLSPPGADWTVAAVNRLIGLGTIWFSAFMVRHTLLIRMQIARNAWLEEGQSRIAKAGVGDLRPQDVAGAQLDALAGFVRAQAGALYRREGAALVRVAQYALASDAAPERLRLGEGIVGEVARSGNAMVLRTLPGDYLRIVSATGSAQAQSLIAAPITAGGQLFGVVELGFMRVLADDDDPVELMARLGDDLGTSLRAALYRERVDMLLEETQRQSAELEERQEELKAANEELEEQSKALQESQARLENQQAELEETNAQLEAYTSDLERQKQELLRAQRALNESALALQRSSRYKSEFLANMSHELRTPLNSSLILAKVLADNAGGNLTEEQVGYANVIQSSNNDLLALINDILDLSKIEAGHADIQPEPVAVAEMLERLRSTFEPVAAERKIAFGVEAAAHLPAAIVTDARRLEQILRNLLSNAFKFTDAGSVRLHVLPAPEGRLAFEVEDTGIGIAPEDQERIFEAFQQADGTVSRKHGGTGLGLSISRELATLLGGTLEVRSTPGAGSVFTLVIPIELHAREQAEPPAVAEPALRPATKRSDAKVASIEVNRIERRAIETNQDEAPPGARTGDPSKRARTSGLTAYRMDDDRDRRTHPRLILVVEDDLHFAEILYRLAHELGFDCVHTASGAEALSAAKTFKPQGILLDVGLPDDSGLSVLERLKRDPETRPIPIHVMSVDDYTQSALELGAVGYTLKPAAREQLIQAMENLRDRSEPRTRSVLIVEDDEPLRTSLAVLLQAPDVEIVTAGTAGEARELLAARSFDCLVMDLALPDASGFELLERIGAGGKYASPPVIVYTGRALTPEDEQRLRRYSRSVIIKGARSPERLLDEVTLFLHRIESKLPAEQQRLLRQARSRDAALDGRKILLAEDDVRNVYALTSLLEPLGMQLAVARNGKQAVEAVADGGDFDLVLMDVMMPEMDGLSAIREIRKLRKGGRLPIIALTAKAMPEDRQACLDAGASDYIAKPIDVDRLLSLCRVWVPK